MRIMLAGTLALAAAILSIDAGRPSFAGEQFSVSDYRANFVYRYWGARHTYRFHQYDSHHTLIMGPRYHYRLRRQGFEFQRRDPWTPRVEVHAETQK